MKAGESAVTFVDDMLMLACARILTEANAKIIDMMECPGGRLDCSCTHHCNFTIDKFGMMGLTRKWELDWHTPGWLRGSPSSQVEQKSLRYPCTSSLVSW